MAITDTIPNNKKTLFQMISTYTPLFWILCVILIFILARGFFIDEWQWWSVMTDFMIGYFFAFSFLQLYTYKSFQEMFRIYDPIAKYFPLYSKIYPFLLILFGVLLLFGITTWLVHASVLILFTLQTLGIVPILEKKEKIQCANIGTKWYVPLSWITVFENAVMITFAIILI